MKYLQLTLLVLLLAYHGMKSTPQHQFLRKFRRLTKSTLLVESVGYTDSVEHNYFNGALINVDEVRNQSKLQLFLPEVDQTYASYYFPINAEVYGLIMRTPSVGWSGSIKLCLYRKRSNVIFQCLEIAKISGDERHDLTRSSILNLSRKSYLLQIKTRQCYGSLDFLNIECNQRTVSYNITENGLEILANETE